MNLQRKLIISLLIVGLLPLSALATTTSTSTKGKAPRQETKSLQEDLKQKKEESRDRVKEATTSEAKKDLAGQIKDELKGIKAERLVAYGDAMKQKITWSIERLENYIERLSGEGSVLARLQAEGKNTTEIQAKLNDAQKYVDQAKDEVLIAETKIRNLINQQPASTTISTTTAKTIFTEAKTSYKNIIKSLKSAQLKIKEALRLIKEVPGARGAKNNATSTKATTTSN